MFKMLKKYYLRMLLLVGFTKGNRQYVLLIFVDSHFPKFIIWFRPTLWSSYIKKRPIWWISSKIFFLNVGPVLPPFVIYVSSCAFLKNCSDLSLLQNRVDDAVCSLLFPKSIFDAKFNFITRNRAWFNITGLTCLKIVLNFIWWEGSCMKIQVTCCKMSSLLESSVAFFSKCVTVCKSKSLILRQSKKRH